MNAIDEDINFANVSLYITLMRFAKLTNCKISEQFLKEILKECAEKKQK